MNNDNDEVLGVDDVMAPDTQNDDTDGEQINDGTQSLEMITEAGYDRSKYYRNLPLVVIAGRPNVGKSTLFNRFLHRRCAITDPTPGVTRDPIERTAFLAGKPVTLMDTGGFKLDRDLGTDEAMLDELVVEKTINSLKKADMILLMLEASAPTGEDEEFISLLRPYWKKVIAAVNKTEGGRGEAEAWNFMQYGFEDVLFISAEHGDNISDLAELIVSKLDFSKVEEGEEQQDIRIAIMGKPNTGKSTLANRLTHSDKSIVSSVAGTTRDVVEGDFVYKNVRCHILDTAGIRRKSKVNWNVEYYSVNRAIKTLRHADIVFYMMDSAEGMTEQDKKIIGLAHEKGCGIIFILNKWDTQEATRTAFKKAEQNIKVMFAHMDYAPVLAISAREGTGIKELLNTTLDMYTQLTRKIETGPLNKALQMWLEAYPPPSGKTTRFRIRYITQTSVNPVEFLMFVSRPEAALQSYIAYIRNCIRRDLGYTNIPVKLDMKASRKKWEDRTN